MTVSQPGAFQTYEDTLATGIVTGSIAMLGTRFQIAPIFPPDWVFAMEMRLLSDDQWVMASADESANEVPGATGLWLPISTINAHQKLWFRQVGASGGILNYIIEGKVRGATQ